MTQTPSVQADSPGPALLAEIAANLAAGRDLRELLARVLQPLLLLANAQAGAVRLLTACGTRLELVSGLGLPAAVHEAERTVDRQCGFCGQCGDELRVTWTRELRDCSLHSGQPFFASDCRCAVAVPLQHKGRLLGIYNLFFDHSEEPAPAVLALLQSIGELLGMALENHRLEAENLRATVSRERRMMAAEVHDAVAQNLTFIKMRMPLLRDAIEAGNQENALAYLEDIRETLGDTHGSLREIVTHFRTRADPRGLARALDLLGAHFRARAHIDLQVQNHLPQLRLPEQEQADLCHIVQEALANIERHSQARHSWLSLESGVGSVEVRIEDDGVGAAFALPAHYGLEIMRERAQRLGGELVVAPREGGGTCVRCTFPLPEPEAA